MARPKSNFSLKEFAIDREQSRGISRLETNIAPSVEPSPEPKVRPPLFDIPKEILDKYDVAKLLGLAPGTIQNWFYKKKLPFVQVGDKQFVLKSSLEEWFRRQEMKPWQ